MDLRSPLLPWRRLVPALLSGLLAGLAQAGMGVTELPARGEDGPVTLFYPTEAQEQPLQRGPLQLSLAREAAPRPGNGRLVVISHGSGGNPWVQSGQARALVEAGFVVALPRHHRDHSEDGSEPGPESWQRRPAEVSRAIDAVAADPRFAPLLRLDRVGVFGQSAGGHTALSLAGGSWSPQRFLRHCEAHLAVDFQACVGLATRLTGGWADGIKQWLALRILRARFDDPRPREHQDARIAAVLAAAPAAADFDPESLARPRVALGLMNALGDRWLHAVWHGERILRACLPHCESVLALPEAGHGAFLDPLPPGLDGLEGELLRDPPGYERESGSALIRARLVDFMQRHLR